MFAESLEGGRNLAKSAAAHKSQDGATRIFITAVILLLPVLPAASGVCFAAAREGQLTVAQEKTPPLFVDVSCTTEDLIRALDRSDLKHQRRYAAELLGSRGAKEAVPNLLRALKDPEEVVQKAAAEALAKLGDSNSFDELIRNLTDSSPTVRMYSSYVLGRLAKKDDYKVIDALQDAAVDSDQNVRVEVIYALYTIGSPSSREIFVKGLNDPDPRIRMHSANALGALKGREAGWALAVALSRESNENVRRTIASALGKVGSAHSVEALIGALSAESASVRADIAIALGEAKTPEAIRALTKLLAEDPSSEVREKAAISLLNAKDPSSVSALAAALSDRVVIVRRPVSEALVGLANPTIVDELVDALADTDTTVADNAMAALIGMDDLAAVPKLMSVLDGPNRQQTTRALVVLREITHREYGSDVAKWKVWFEENFKTGPSQQVDSGSGT
ncbi:MAG: hypothetical protein C4532_07580 [Candidatus Abyssobacteria bacterium SURF_17]|uniref:HEAT repeat domain-containing protein n=1 Tax=Candidatus Abyssobacteria bacterium SURF_17 TaxID=2093361 RepID=A0A419F0U7_9BACT|nr:MAG: hypothetical protein C4532_07580 [Candidatus Abyssubacteria bacterium SURF_17]